MSNGEKGSAGKSIPELICMMREGNKYLLQMAEALEFPWAPNRNNPRELHNSYIGNLVTAYVSKFAQLSEALLNSVETKRYLVYALTGRSLIENTATLYYYVQCQYKPLLDKGSLSKEDMNALLKIDDRHLRGSRFDWESYVFRRYKKLRDDAVRHLASKKSKEKHIVQGIVAEQVNVLTCVEKWAEAIPEVLIVYNLFCDLVHPNIGSTFLVASTTNEHLYFSPSKGESVGEQIFKQSFPMLLSTTAKMFGIYLTVLMGTMWEPDELK